MIRGFDCDEVQHFIKRFLFVNKLIRSQSKNDDFLKRNLKKFLKEILKNIFKEIFEKILEKFFEISNYDEFLEN